MTANTPTMTRLREGYHALIFGATGGLGAALLRHIAADPRCGVAIGVSRRSEPALELTDPASIAACAERLAGHAPFHLVVDATGALTLDGHPPEKRLDDVEAQWLQHAFAVNATGPALLLRHFTPLLALRERVVWAKLSARVGSIGDNRKGGWYGYRASKAALNMLLQCAAIEIARRRPQAVVAALQPGTVATALTQPFVGNDATPPPQAAAHLLRALDGLDAAPHAQFVDHRGEPVPW